MTELLNFRTSGLLYLLTEVSFFFVLNRSENRIPTYNPLFQSEKAGFEAVWINS